MMNAREHEEHPKIILEQLRAKARSLPLLPGVYKMKDSFGRIIYIGASSKLRNRVSSYFFRPPPDPKVQRMVSQIADFDYEIHPTVEAAFLKEQELIRTLKPRYNRMWVDDKSYPLIKITTNEQIPRVLIVREQLDDDATYFGRKISASALRETLKVVRRFFPSCVCKKPHSKPKKPCLEYQIKRCPAPCAGYISLAEYKKQIEALISFLNGDKPEILESLEEEMMMAAKQLNFERAAELRDIITSLKKTIGNATPEEIPRELDVILLARTPLPNRKTLESTRKNSKIREETGDLVIAKMLHVDGDQIIQEKTLTLEGVLLPNEMIITSLIKNQYLRSVEVPKWISPPVLPEEHDLLATWLSKRKGQSVELLTHEELIQKRPWLQKILTVMQAKIEKDLMDEISKRQSVEAFSILALQQIRDILGLSSIPHRIEGYDISNIQGSLAVGSMVVFLEGKPAKKEYRRFNIRLKEAPNDYAMLQEVVSRRLAHLDTDMPRPDLMLIDGGKGQLNAVHAILEEMERSDIPVISLAKKHELFFIPFQKEPVDIAPDSPAGKLLRQVRDEAHRFALISHQKRRLIQTDTSILNDIPGIGKVRRTRLLQHFGSVKAIEAATLEELLAVPGFTRKAAESVYMFFQTRKAKKRPWHQ